MKSGIISLQSLYLHAEQDRMGASLRGSSPNGRSYGKVAKDAVESIPEQRGFYLWGKYEDNGLWTSTYLGKAGFGKTSNLRARILEELKDERWCIWSSVLSRIKMSELGQEYYPLKWSEQYYSHFKRALLKTESSHIVWVATPSLTNKQVKNIESDLIETLNPRANRSRPVPPKSLQAFTMEVISQIRERVHEKRADRYPTNSLE